MSDETQETTVEVSPTGKPIIPPWVAPIGAGVAGLAQVLVQVLPSHTIAWKVCSLIAGLAAAAGWLSPGARTRPPQ